MPKLPSILLTVLCVGIIRSLSQTPETEVPVCDDEFARFLVEQQVAESRTVEQTDKRIRILTRSADFLWKVDQPAAREHFMEAFRVAADRFREKGFERSEKKGLITMKPDYRFEVVRAIAKRDAEWAKKLIEQILKEYEKDSADRKEIDKTREIYETLQVAGDSVGTNAELSRYLFRRVMQHPLDYHWFWVLFSVARENREFADSLYSELLTNYANATPRRLLFLSAYPFASARIVGPERFNYGTTVPEAFEPNRNFQRQFIELFLHRVASFAADPQNLQLTPEENRMAEPVYMMSALAELEPVIIQHFPALIQRLTEAKAQAAGMLNEQMRKDLGESDARNESLGFGFERRLKQLEEAETNNKLTDGMIVSLLTWGETRKTEEQFKLLEPWLAKIKDASARDAAINYFWFIRSELAVKERRLEDAERYAKKIPEVEARAILMFQIAEAQLKNVNDSATVYQTLREVGRLAEQSETSPEKARVILALVNQYIKINPIFAMQELGDAIRVINRLENADILSTSVTKRIITKNSSFFASFSMPGYDFEKTFTEISKDNFEMSLSNAKSLEDKYLRTLAVLAVAKNCVDRPRKKPAAKQVSN